MLSTQRPKLHRQEHVREDGFRIKLDYTRQICQKHRYYSVPRRDGDSGEPGSPEPNQSFFQILDVQTRAAQPKTIKSFDEEDVFSEVGFVVQVSFLDVWRKNSDKDFTVFHDDSPTFASISKLGAWRDLFNHMKFLELHGSGVKGCVDLRNGRLAQIPLSLGDFSTPCAVLVREQKRCQWYPFPRRAEHRD